MEDKNLHEVFSASGRCIRTYERNRMPGRTDLYLGWANFRLKVIPVEIEMLHL